MLKVFVSTQETQGQRENDFNFVPEGELVMFGMLTCSNEHADDGCGCARSMCGTLTHLATTTMKVVEYTGETSLADTILTSLKESGWIGSMYEQAGLISVNPYAIAKRILKAAAPFHVGAIVEYRDGQFAERMLQEASNA
jgi:hypothetical protein